MCLFAVLEKERFRNTIVTVNAYDFLEAIDVQILRLPITIQPQNQSPEITDQHWKKGFIGDCSSLRFWEWMNASLCYYLYRPGKHSGPIRREAQRPPHNLYSCTNKTHTAKRQSNEGIKMWVLFSEFLHWSSNAMVVNRSRVPQALLPAVHGSFFVWRSPSLPKPRIRVHTF